jgi:hypothetical protein
MRSRFEKVFRIDRSEQKPTRGGTTGWGQTVAYPPGHEERIRAHTERVDREQPRHLSEAYRDDSNQRGKFRDVAFACCRQALAILAARPRGKWLRRKLAETLGVSVGQLRRYLLVTDWFSPPHIGVVWVELTAAGVAEAQRTLT